MQNLLQIMEFISDNGKLINVMAPVNNILKMVPFIMDNGKTMKQTDKVDWSIMMEIFMKGLGVMIKLMEKESITTRLMDLNTKENSKMICSMDKE